MGWDTLEREKKEEEENKIVNWREWVAKIKQFEEEDKRGREWMKAESEGDLEKQGK